MYKLEFGEEHLIIISIYKKIFRELDLTCIKEFCDPAMIEDKLCTSASPPPMRDGRESG